MKEEKKDNAKLWNLVCNTDKNFTKAFSGKGGFKGTAINAHYQKQTGTKIFGMFGCDWGLKDLDINVLHISDNQKESILKGVGVFYANFEGNKISFPIISDIDIWNYSHKYKSYTKNNDIFKKLQTDMISKSLSALGFNADVFMNDFSDNKYITYKEETVNLLNNDLPLVKPTPPPKKEPIKKTPPTNEKALEYIKKVKSKEDFENLKIWLNKYPNFAKVADIMKAFKVIEIDYSPKVKTTK